MSDRILLSAGTAILLVLTACSEKSGESPVASGADTDTQMADPAMPAAVKAPEEPAAGDERTSDAAAAAAAPEAAGTPEPEKQSEQASPPAPVAAAAVATPAPARPAAFARCVACHDAEKGGPDKLGPNLFGIAGNKAGAHGSFAYSDALKSSGLVWTDANLHAWLENPRTLVPGNKMAFPGLKDAAKRQEIIDYLKALK